MTLRGLAKEWGSRAASAIGLPRLLLSHLGGVLVLTYHSFSRQRTDSMRNQLPIDELRGQLEFISKVADVMSLSDAFASHAGKRLRAVVTVDDGFRDNFELLFPLAQSVGVPLCLFVSTGFVDSGVPPWPTRIIEMLERTGRRKLTFPLCAPIETRRERVDVVRRIKREWGSLCKNELDLRLALMEAHTEVHTSEVMPMTWEMLRTMRNAGCEVGSHGVDHLFLSRVPNEDRRREALLSRQRIIAELGSCDYFAYPNGEFSSDTGFLLSEVGYRAALTQAWGLNDDMSFAMKRIEVPFDEPLHVFKARVSTLLRPR